VEEERCGVVKEGVGRGPGGVRVDAVILIGVSTSLSDKKCCAIASSSNDRDTDDVTPI
jgi:hypothetical protein